VRGFRNSNDYLHELVLYQNYLSQNSNLEFINLFSSNDFISSTAVKEMVLVGGEIHKSVPLLVKKALEKRLKNQTIISLSGGIGSGKSTVSKKLIEKLQSQNLPAQKIDLDELGHEILLGKSEAEKIARQKIMDKFGTEILDKNQNIDRSKLAVKVFSNKLDLKFLTDLIHPLVLLKLRQSLQSMTGIIFLESAIWEEYNLTYLCNNTVILLENSPQIIQQRLLARGLDLDQIQQRIANQFNFEEKKLRLEKSIEKDNYRQIWDLKTDDLDENELDNLVTKIIKYTQNYV
jgi:dephospho-CoA kinase